MHVHFQEEREKERNKMLEEKILPFFKDKALARPIIVMWSADVLLGEKKTVFDFLEELMQNKELRKELEKKFGSPIEETRLKAIINEKAWPDIRFRSLANP